MRRLLATLFCAAMLFGATSAQAASTLPKERDAASQAVTDPFGHTWTWHMNCLFFLLQNNRLSEVSHA